MNSIKFGLAGDSSFIINFGNEIAPEINKKIRKMMIDLKNENIDGIIELVPTYCSILVTYDPCRIEYLDLKNRIEKLSEKLPEIESEDEVTLIEIPTLYNDEFGPDLEYVAKYNNLTKEEVIKIHTGTDYLVYMLGFMPGFTYLGGMSKKIETPRLESPRLEIAPGSVGIAGKQTGMYPSVSPGGWQIIGRTPLKLYVPESEQPVFINSGDYIRYISIDETEYRTIENMIKEDKYTINIRKVKRGELNA